MNRNDRRIVMKYEHPHFYLISGKLLRLIARIARRVVARARSVVKHGDSSSEGASTGDRRRYDAPKHDSNRVRLLESEAPKVFYLSISLKAPVGGVRVNYLHAEELSSNGIPAFVVHRSERFRCDWFDSDAMVCSYSQLFKYADRERDAVVIPDIWVNDVKDFADFRNRVIFVQNYGALDFAGAIAARSSCRFMTCGKYLTDKLQQEHEIEASPIYSPLDDFFVPAEQTRQPERVMYLARKDLGDAIWVAEKLKERFPEYEMVGIKNVPTRQELATEYQKSNIFMAIGYPEGFPFPPLEAMACGCLVVGYTGGGGSEYMVDGKTAFVAQDANRMQLLAKLEQAILGLRDGSSERVRQAGQEATRRYTQKLFKQTLLAYPWFDHSVAPAREPQCRPDGQ